MRARLRFPVATVVAMVADGMTTEEILDEHPDLEAADVAECLRFAALAVQERELPLRQPGCGPMGCGAPGASLPSVANNIRL